MNEAAESLRVVICTFPDLETARDLGAKIVEEHLAACANILSGVESIYRWQEKVERADEALVLLKTTASRVAALQAKITTLHPYGLPEIIV